MKKRKSIIVIAITIILILAFCMPGCKISAPTEYSNQVTMKDEADDDVEQKRHVTILGSESTYYHLIRSSLKVLTDIGFSNIGTGSGYVLSSEEIMTRLI